MSVFTRAGRLALALLAGGAPASSAAAPTTFGVSPLPNRERDPARLFLGDSLPQLQRIALGDERIDVALEHCRVDLDVYPTFVTVRTRLALVAGERGAPKVTVGFPEQIPRGSSPVVALDVRVNRTPIEPKFDGIWINAFDLSARTVAGPDAAALHRERIDSWGASAWWTWRMDFTRRTHTMLEASYAVALSPVSGETDAGRQRFHYVLRTAALWKGPVGHLEIRLVLHGLDPSSLQVESESGIRSQEGEVLIWNLDGAEPPRDLVFAWPTTDPPPIDEPLSPAHALLDEAVRMGRGAAEPAAWQRFVETLRHASELEDAHARVLALALLEDLRRAVGRLPEFVGSPALPPEFAHATAVELGVAAGRGVEWLGGPPAARGAECDPPGETAAGYGSKFPPDCRPGRFEGAAAENVSDLAALALAADPGPRSSRTTAVAAGVGGLAGLGLLTLGWARRRRRRTG